MEYFQIVDINGKPTGDIISIDELKKNHGVPPEGTYLKVVKVVIVNSKDQVLLQKWSETKPVNPGVWGLCGGKVNLKENPIDIFPCVLTVITIYTVGSRNTKITRFGCLFASVCWIIYAIAFKSWLVIICESYLSICTIIGLIKYNLKKENNKTEATKL